MEAASGFSLPIHADDPHPLSVVFSIRETELATERVWTIANVDDSEK
jgi:hypothetical protein